MREEIDQAREALDVAREALDAALSNVRTHQDVATARGAIVQIIEAMSAEREASILAVDEALAALKAIEQARAKARKARKVRKGE